MDKDDEKHVVSPETKNKISSVIFFAACVHGFGAASVSPSPETWDNILAHSLCYITGSLITGFLVLRFADRHVSLIISFLIKSCLMFAGGFVPTGPWSLILLSMCSLISSSIDVVITSFILDCWQDESMDILLGSSAFYSAGFVISYFCPIGKGFFSLDKIAAILMILVAIAFAILCKRERYQDHKRRLKDGKTLVGQEFDDLVVHVIKPFSRIVFIIALCNIILLLTRVLWYNTILMLKNFYIDLGFSVHLPLAEVTLRLLMSGSVVVFILVSRIGQFNKNVLVYISLCLIMIGTLFLIMTTKNPSMMWAALAFLGFGFSAAVPLIFCVMERVMNVTNRVTAVLVATFGLSDLIRSSEGMVSFSRYTFSGINMMVCTLTIFLFFGLTYAESKFTKRTIKGDEQK